MPVYLGSNQVGACVKPSEDEGWVKFIDYDGTVLHEYSTSEFLALSAMPSNPSHTGLVAQGWNWSLSDAQAFVEEWGYLIIGQQYITSSGDTELDITLYNGRLAPYLGIAVNGQVTVNWGDNSSTDTITGSSLSTQIRTQHIYAAAGNYTISIHVDSGSFIFYITGNYYILNANDTVSSSNQNRVYTNAIKAIRIGEGIGTNIGTLSYCTSLETITIPTSCYGNCPFQNCYNLKALVLPYGPSNYSVCNCNTCYNLTYISMPKKINTCGSSTFASCYSLKYLIFPDTLTNLDSAYRGSQSNFTWNINVLIIPRQNLKLVNNYTPYNINNSLSGTSIASEFFGSIQTLVNAEIPNTITSIGGYIFYNCQSLETVSIPTSITSISGNYICGNCYRLKTANFLPNLANTTLAQSNQFYNCYSLKSITLASTITKLGGSFFSTCKSLQSINLPSNLTIIDSSTFSYCESLCSITIPSTVTSIGSSAFNYCYSLSSLTIPANVTTIGNSAFGNCYGISEYHFLSTTPPTLSQNATSVFSNITSDCKIYVPSSAVDTYKTANYWSTVASYIVGE